MQIKLHYNVRNHFPPPRSTLTAPPSPSPTIDAAPYSSTHFHFFAFATGPELAAALADAAEAAAITGLAPQRTTKAEEC